MSVGNAILSARTRTILNSTDFSADFNQVRVNFSQSEIDVTTFGKFLPLSWEIRIETFRKLGQMLKRRDRTKPEREGRETVNGIPARAKIQSGLQEIKLAEWIRNGSPLNKLRSNKTTTGWAKKLTGISQATLDYTGFQQVSGHTLDSQLFSMLGAPTVATAWEVDTPDSNVGSIRYTGNAFLKSYNIDNKPVDVAKITASLSVTGAVTRASISS